MIFHPTPLGGSFVIDIEKRGDSRGFFARLFCEKEFAHHGLETRFVQVNNSCSTRAGTLRGMHYQLPPDTEVKLVRCVRGALFDVIIDLRLNSPTYRHWYGAELSADNHRMMYVPRGFAHGFITLCDETEAIYLVSDFYSPASERGLRYDDPSIGISWPFKPAEISEKDLTWPPLNEAYHGVAALGGVQ